MKTVRVRIAVAVDAGGAWAASGWRTSEGPPADANAMDVAIDGVGDGEARYWLEADLPVPEVTTRQGTVSKDGERKPLTPAQIDAAVASMPGGVKGFLRDWGYLHLARAIEALHGIDR